MTDHPTRLENAASQKSADGDPAERVPAAKSERDFHLLYGFGHKAHKPDPNATYSFDMGPPKTLPLKGTAY